MRVMVLVKATDDSERGFVVTPESTRALEAMGRFNQELAEAGILIMADGLTPSSQGKRVAFDGAGRAVIDGPFAQPGELVAGFWLWNVSDMDEAVDWVKRPTPCPGQARSRFDRYTRWPTCDDPLAGMIEPAEAATVQPPCTGKEKGRARNRTRPFRNPCGWPYQAAFGAAWRTPSSTWSENWAKLSMNWPTSLRAVAS